MIRQNQRQERILIGYRVSWIVPCLGLSAERLNRCYQNKNPLLYTRVARNCNRPDVHNRTAVAKSPNIVPSWIPFKDPPAKWLASYNRQIVRCTCASMCNVIASSTRCDAIVVFCVWVPFKWLRFKSHRSLLLYVSQWCFCRNVAQRISRAMKRVLCCCYVVSGEFVC